MILNYQQTFISLNIELVKHFTVRCYKKVPIFDVYYDKLKPLGGKIISITNGYGKIKPKLFQAK